MLETMLETV